MEVDGIFEKTILVSTLFGLPMLSVDLPNRIAAPSLPPVVPGTPAIVGSGPGTSLALRTADVTLTTNLQRQTLTLTDDVTNQPVQTVYYRGANGQVARPGYPIQPLAIANVTNNAGIVRGAGFRGGAFTDEANIQPHTSVPATELAGSHPVFYSANFFPAQPWQLNYYDYLSGGPQGAGNGTIRLMLTPTQFQSNAIGSPTGTMHRFSNMQFRLFYSDNRSAAALAAPPTIAHVAATVSANDLHFAVEVNRSDENTDVQEVWITYSTVNGTNWQSLDLDRNASNIVLWEGTLTNVNPAQLRFMVQAASGTGLVTLDTNRGDYYTLGIDPGAVRLPPVAGAPQPQATSLMLQNPPTAGPFTSQASFAARLTDSGGAPLSGQIISFGLGGQRLQATTNGNGQATVTFLLSDKPGTYTAQVAFAGTPDYGATAATGAFTINKQGTNLALAPATLAVVEGTDGSFTATLRDAANRGLRERTVLYVIRSGSTIVYSKGSITDYQGRAVLAVAPAQLGVGTYQVTAYFGGGSPIAGLTLTDLYYASSTTTATLVIILKST